MKSIKTFYPTGCAVYKSPDVIKLSNIWTTQLSIECPIKFSSSFEEWMQKKPKSTSFRNWVYPFIVLNYPNATDIELDKSYQTLKEWYDNNSTEVRVQVSAKIHHLCQCFTSPFFKTCGTGTHLKKAQDSLKKSNVFCIFIKDKAGHIIARRILKKIDNALYYYTLYGNSWYQPAIDGILTKICIDNNLTKVKRFSFL